ncbi:hypothetical protein RchiOBHm_Chr7g0233851 [Rosa chinensis]|uniref:Uncharacterized protein n=1 Tax=Rosa chinensis TaxID=74649 RepID=A0A2P6P8F5_ROSCH|nr:hypothetical protein RchiOBHm_Chr7g0203451 [Rosa chinensis]PRQ20961.1 hypothetical protein RchiOBHm_Chr7g0233851 [Rosa chinensis]
MVVALVSRITYGCETATSAAATNPNLVLGSSLALDWVLESLGYEYDALSNPCLLVEGQDLILDSAGVDWPLSYVRIQLPNLRLGSEK